jgi:hypothetical protein
LLDETETLIESGNRRFKGTEAKANLVSAATSQITLWAVIESVSRQFPDCPSS